MCRMRESIQYIYTILNTFEIRFSVLAPRANKIVGNILSFVHIAAHLTNPFGNLSLTDGGTIGHRWLYVFLIIGVG